MEANRGNTLAETSEPISGRTALSWTIGAWAVFVGGFLLLCLTHYNSTTLQQSDTLWFTTHILLILITMPVLWRGTACFHHLASRLGILAIQTAVGFCVYLCLAFMYLYEWAGFSK